MAAKDKGCWDDQAKDVTATIEEAGQKLGGMANVAFESEEDTPDISIQVQAPPAPLS